MRNLIFFILVAFQHSAIGQTSIFKYDPLVTMQNILSTNEPKKIKKMMKKEGFKVDKKQKNGEGGESVLYSKDDDWYYVSFNSSKNIISIQASVSPQYLYNSFKDEMLNKSFFQAPHKEVKNKDGGTDKTFLYKNRNYKFQFLSNFSEYTLLLITPDSYHYTNL